MNIFVLDNDPQKCAEYHCDKHVVKMILEHAQMMCTAHHLHPNKTVKYEIPYKQTHVNHPCSKWVRDSLANYKWLYQMTYHLNEEYKHRFNHDVNHKSFDVIDNLPLPSLMNVPQTKWARAMPVEYKHDDVIKSYRTYYINDKVELLKYTKRDMPTWLTVEND